MVEPWFNERLKYLSHVDIHMADFPTKAQNRIMDHAESLFDIDWIQATSENRINVDILESDREDLETFMSIHEYDLWTEYRVDAEYHDISFKKE